MMTLYFQCNMDHVHSSGSWIHMTSHRVIFDTHEISSLCNIYLGYGNVMKTIKMGLIVVEVILKGRIKRIHIKNVFHVSKLQENFVKWVENVI